MDDRDMKHRSPVPEEELLSPDSFLAPEARGLFCQDRPEPVEPSKVKIPGGEPLRTFRNRVTKEMNQILESHEEGGVVVVSHGGVICTYLTSLLGLKLDDLWSFKIRNGSITRVIFPQGYPRIEVLNDVSHLNGAIRYAPNTPPKYLL